MKLPASLMMAAMAVLVASSADSTAQAAEIKLSKSCKELYQQWQWLGGSKAFFATTDGSHCGYSFGRPTISYAINYAMHSCNKYGKGEKCVRLE